MVLSSAIISCASIPPPGERRDHANTLALAAGWQATKLSAGQFNLLAYAPARIIKTPSLTVYMEGDGFAWISSSMPSADPTPRDPLALRLALAQPDGNAVYLGRPCQYVDAKRTKCPQRYWMQARFAPEVVDATRLAIDVLKDRFGATRLTLVGYSGGAAVAVLVAEGRDDVEQLITVAGNLDHDAWTQHHRMDPLQDSLNPADVADRLGRVPQIHFIGASDEVIPAELAYRWPQAFRGVNNANIRLIQQFNHACCWADQWGRLYRQAIKK